MLPDIKTILYATALGSGAPYVFRYALQEARKHQAKIIILHVMEPLNPFGQHLVELHISPDQSEQIHEQARHYAIDKIKKRLQKLCDAENSQGLVCNDLIADICVVEGQPHYEIIARAKDLGADLIVIGSHRHSALGEAMLGHTANKVVHRAEQPVLLVRIPEGYHDEAS